VHQPTESPRGFTHVNILEWYTGTNAGGCRFIAGNVLLLGNTNASMCSLANRRELDEALGRIRKLLTWLCSVVGTWFQLFVEIVEFFNLKIWEKEIKAGYSTGRPQTSCEIFTSIFRRKETEKRSEPSSWQCHQVSGVDGRGLYSRVWTAQIVSQKKSSVNTSTSMTFLSPREHTSSAQGVSDSLWLSL
jgi:hypothetical protein